MSRIQDVMFQIVMENERRHLASEPLLSKHEVREMKSLAAAKDRAENRAAKQRNAQAPPVAVSLARESKRLSYMHELVDQGSMYAHT